MIIEKSIRNLKYLLETAEDGCNQEQWEAEALKQLFGDIAEDYLVLPNGGGQHNIKYLLYNLENLRPHIAASLADQICSRVPNDIPVPPQVQEGAPADAPSLGAMQDPAENESKKRPPSIASAPFPSNGMGHQKDWFDVILDWASGFMGLFGRQT